MKIKNIENGQEVVYVQRRDINECLKKGYEFSCDFDAALPVNESPVLRTAEKYEDMVFKKTTRNKSFVRLSNPDDVRKILQTEWIVDFDQVYAMNITELAEVIETSEVETMLLKDSVKDCQSPEKARNVLNKAKKYTYVIASLKEILDYRLLVENLDLPSVANNVSSAAFPVASLDYVIKRGLNPEEVFITTRNGLPFTNLGEIPRRLIAEIIAMQSVILQDNEDHLTKMNLSYSLSQDHKTLIIKLNKTLEFTEHKAEVLNFRKEALKLKVRKNIKSIKNKLH